jgi:hypothetical protein
LLVGLLVPALTLLMRQPPPTAVPDAWRQHVDPESSGEVEFASPREVAAALDVRLGPFDELPPAPSSDDGSALPSNRESEAAPAVELEVPSTDGGVKLPESTGDAGSALPDGQSSLPLTEPDETVVSFLKLSGESKLGEGTFILLVDGEQAYSRELIGDDGERRRRKRIETFETTLPIPPGEHEIVARVVLNDVARESLEQSVVLSLEADTTVGLRVVAGNKRGQPVSLSVDEARMPATEIE